MMMAAAGDQIMILLAILASAEQGEQKGTCDTTCNRSHCHHRIHQNKRKINLMDSADQMNDQTEKKIRDWKILSNRWKL